MGNHANLINKNINILNKPLAQSIKPISPYIDNSKQVIASIDNRKQVISS